MIICFSNIRSDQRKPHDIHALIKVNRSKSGKAKTHKHTTNIFMHILKSCLTKIQSGNQTWFAEESSLIHISEFP